MTANKLYEARGLLLQESFGVLSTISTDVPGYPFGSVAPYCVDRECQPMIYISTIAQHTKNIVADPKVALTVIEPNSESDDVQSRGRLTLLANARRVDREDVDGRERYMRHFPGALPFEHTHDFMFFRLDIVRARFIGGFGQIFWLTREELCLSSPFTSQEEIQIIRQVSADLNKQITGVDAEGFDMLENGKKRRILFDSPVRTVDDAHRQLAAMAGR